MSATSQVTDFSDLYTDLENRVRAATGVTATGNQAKRYINIALHDMHIGNGEKFPWAERRAILLTRAPYSTGTVTATKGSTTLTGSSTAWTTTDDFSIANARAGGKVVIAGGREVYGVSTVGGATSITLDFAFTQTTTSGATYNYFEDEYALATDFLRPIDLRFFDENRTIALLDRRSFYLRYPKETQTGKPQAATIIDLAPSGDTTVRRRLALWKPPDAVYSIPYRYVTSYLAVSSSGTGAANLSADADEPIVPLAYRHAIVFHALYHWYRDKKNDDRAQEAKAEYAQLMARIEADNEIGMRRPQFYPRMSGYRRSAERPYSGSGSRYGTGTWFDDLKDRR